MLKATPSCKSLQAVNVPQLSPPPPLCPLSWQLATCAQSLRLKSIWKMLSLVNFLACDAVQQQSGEEGVEGGGCTLIYVLHATTRCT